VPLQEKGGVAAGDKVYGIRDEVKWGALKIVNSPMGSMLTGAAKLYSMQSTNQLTEKNECVNYYAVRIGVASLIYQLSRAALLFKGLVMLPAYQLL